MFVEHRTSGDRAGRHAEKIIQGFVSYLCRTYGAQAFCNLPTLPASLTHPNTRKPRALGPRLLAFSMG